ncbi:tetratricopeptide repeat protein [Acidisphaera sp. S103]|uniref:tetratricopeptide repeat protein n=1 Tax=Acidisphaera sp. S103 TaxID=1747223 RepID=UPI00131AADEF|nr:tetratricopeptide repeat protein [Acidisphaera sp. S103]
MSEAELQKREAIATELFQKMQTDIYNSAKSAVAANPPPTPNEAGSAAQGLLPSVAELPAATGDGTMQGPLEGGVAAMNRSDWRTAVSILLPLAEQGNARAQTQMGNIIMDNAGLVPGVRYNGPSAWQWFNMAAERGDPEGAVNAANMLVFFASRDPARAETDYAAAMKLYRQAADQGFSKADLGLGEMYEKGEGVPQDYSAAIKWYQKAAAQGDQKGQQYAEEIKKKAQQEYQKNKEQEDRQIASLLKKDIGDNVCDLSGSFVGQVQGVNTRNGKIEIQYQSGGTPEWQFAKDFYVCNPSNSLPLAN